MAKISWDDARYFLAVVREEQMLGAARRLGVSQAKLSRRVGALETSLGRQLLERTTRGCFMTEDGRTVYAAAERVEAEFISALNKIGDRDLLQGTVRIGAPDGFGGAFFAAHLGELCALYPRLNIQLVPMPRSFSLSEREADLAVMVGRPERGRLRCRLLTDYTLGLYASQSYLERVKPPQSLDELKEHRLVGYVEDMIYTPELNYASEVTTKWQSTVEIATAAGQLEAVVSGAGIGILHDFMAVSRSELVALFPKVRITRSYWTVWHENLKNTPRVQAVVKFLDTLARTKQSLFIRGE